MSKRIMILEDEPLLAMLVESMLEDMGHVPLNATSRDEAFRTIEESHPDLVLLDVNLWGAPSTDLARDLAERAIPFVLMTGYDAAEMRSTFGAVPVLSKPFDAQGLADALACLPA